MHYQLADGQFILRVPQFFPSVRVQVKRKAAAQYKYNTLLTYIIYFLLEWTE